MRGVGEASCILDLINVLENFPKFSKPKNTCHQGTSLFAFILNLCVFLGQWSPYVPVSFTLNLLKWCLVSFDGCSESLLLPFYDHFERFAFRIQEPAKPDLNRTQFGLKFKIFEALLDLILGKNPLSCPVAIAKRLLCKPSPGRRVKGSVSEHLTESTNPRNVSNK